MQSRLMTAIAAASIALSTAASAQTETVIWNFEAGSAPTAGLLLDSKTGALYGATSGGGNGYGTIFSLIRRHGVWMHHVIHTFDDSDGSTPYAGLVEDSAGNLYGTTFQGGAFDGGTVFELNPGGSSWTETVLHSFAGGSSDGTLPNSDLTIDKTTGEIFGTTSGGGAYHCGTAFEMTQSSGEWKESVIHTFEGGQDGCSPQARLREVSKRRLYGATNLGGNYARGTAFVLVNSNGVWSESPIHSFSGTSDGKYPVDLDLDPKTETLYGTTETGGNSDHGVVFQLTHIGGVWTEATLYNFAGRPDGDDPLGLHLDLASGKLYGTTYIGGPSDSGTVFQLVGTGSSWTYSQMYSFGVPGDGLNPVPRPTVDPNTGYLYGTTSTGGTNSSGTAWMITP